MNVEEREHMRVEKGSVGLAMIGCGGISEAHLRGIANMVDARLVATMAVLDPAKESSRTDASVPIS